MDTATAALALTLAIALIGALTGAAGFAAFIVGLQNRRIARIAERLARADADNPVLAAEAARIRDPRLRGAFGELADRVAQTWVQATVDPLTGIANRQTVLSRVEEELVRAARYHRPLSLILVDLDHFKRCNDSHGHASGDLILRNVAQLLAANVRT
ncbi:MAG TPA: GGDEF domain-containing protein, partial [Candidatus Limnocylindrales bacterium]